jgi:hypothetical protein
VLSLTACAVSCIRCLSALYRSRSPSLLFRQELDARDAGIESCEIEKDIFAELATVFEELLLLDLGGRGVFSAVWWRGGELVGSCNEGAWGEETFGDSFEGFLFNVQEAGFVELVFFSLIEDLEGRHLVKLARLS